MVVRCSVHLHGEAADAATEAAPRTVLDERMDAVNRSDIRRA